MKTYTIEPNVSLYEVVEQMIAPLTSLDLLTANNNINLFDYDIWKPGLTINLPEYSGERPPAGYYVMAPTPPAPKTTTAVATRTVIPPRGVVRPDLTPQAAPEEDTAVDTVSEGGGLMDWINDPKKAMVLVAVAGALVWFFLLRKPSRASNPGRKAKGHKLPNKVLVHPGDIVEEDYDAIEIMPVGELDDGELEAHPSGPVFGWCVYLHLKKGGVETVSDHSTKKGAKQAAKRLSKLFGWPISDQS